MGVPSLGTMKVTANLWRTTSRLANSTSGMRWPIPAVGTTATWGGFCASSSMDGLGLSRETKKKLTWGRMNCEDFGAVEANVKKF